MTEMPSKELLDLNRGGLEGPKLGGGRLKKAEKIEIIREKPRELKERSKDLTWARNFQGKKAAWYETNGMRIFLI